MKATRHDVILPALYHKPAMRFFLNCETLSLTHTANGFLAVTPSKHPDFDAAIAKLREYVSQYNDPCVVVISSPCTINRD